MGPRFVAVIDIGKTNAKLALVDLDMRAEIAALRQPNRPLVSAPYPHHDEQALRRFVTDGLATLACDHRIDAIAVTTHGATAALVDAAGRLALPVLDYEFDVPARLRERYDAIRPDFAQSGSPALPLGLNLGVQLYWLQDRFPDLFDRAAAILTWPQYWSWRLTGVMAGEVTSLGCHTDLWAPRAGDFSSLVDAAGWRRLFPPLRPAGAVLGPLRPGLARTTGLDPRTPVINGIHDSNASLLPHLIDRAPPFAVVSTGTWVVAMAVGGRETTLDPARDTLINVNAFGDPVPSARFMGGREFELLMDGHPRRSDAADVAAVLESGTALLPSAVAGSGPFPDRKARWLGTEPRAGQRHVAVSFYLALMAATCLDLVGARGPAVVEGPFASNEPFLAMLAAATGRPVVAGEGAGTGTSIGAALLVRNEGRAKTTGRPDAGPAPRAMRRYADAWRAATAGAP